MLQIFHLQQLTRMLELFLFRTRGLMSWQGLLKNLRECRIYRQKFRRLLNLLTLLDLLPVRTNVKDWETSFCPTFEKLMKQSLRLQICKLWKNSRNQREQSKIRV